MKKEVTPAQVLMLGIGLIVVSDICRALLLSGNGSDLGLVWDLMGTLGLLLAVGGFIFWVIRKLNKNAKADASKPEQS